MFNKNKEVESNTKDQDDKIEVKDNYNFVQLDESASKDVEQPKEEMSLEEYK